MGDNATPVFVEQEIIFTGTPAQFLSLVDTYEERRQWSRRGGTKLHVFDNRVEIWALTPDHAGTIVPHDLPGGRSLVVFWTTPHEWPAVEPYWREVLAELDRLNCIEGTAAQPPAAPEPKRRTRSTSNQTDANAREALRLYEDLAMTQEQIAERLSVSVKTVQRWLNRARKLNNRTK